MEPMSAKELLDQLMGKQRDIPVAQQRTLNYFDKEIDKPAAAFHPNASALTRARRGRSPPLRRFQPRDVQVLAGRHRAV
jgi:hypothetical protein